MNPGDLAIFEGYVVEVKATDGERAIEPARSVLVENLPGPPRRFTLWVRPEDLTRVEVKS